MSRLGFPAGWVLLDCPGKTGLTFFLNRSDRFSPSGLSWGLLSRRVSVMLWLFLFKGGEVLEVFRACLVLKVFWGFPRWNRPDWFAKPAWPVSPACERLSPRRSVWPVSETGLTGFGCQQMFRVAFRCVFRVVVGWILLLGPVALQWLCGLGKRSLWRCPSEIGFIGRILE
jgi:hypothetical protein